MSEEVFHKNFELKNIRTRIFIEIDRISVLKVRDERTFFNPNEVPVEIFSFDLGSFKPQLRIVDRNGCLLEYYGKFFNDDIPETTVTDHNIFVKFSDSSVLQPKDITTISFHYTLELADLQPESMTHVSFPIGTSDHTYIHFKKPLDYDLKIKEVLFCDESTGSCYRINAPHTESNLIIIENEQFFNLELNKPLHGYQIELGITHSLDSSDTLWIYSGLVIGIICLILNIILAFNNLIENYEEIIGLSTFAGSYLLIVKGWLFTSDIDYAVKFFRSPFIFKDYSTTYISLILLFLLELIIFTLIMQIQVPSIIFNFFITGYLRFE